MGLFKSKQKFKKEALPDLFMVLGVDVIGKLRAFNGIDDNYTLAVNYGYFYGFLRMELSTKLSIKEADEIIDKSIEYLGEAIGGKVKLENFIYVVRTNYNNAFENIKRSANSNDIIEHMAQLYLNDLYQKEMNDDIRLTVSKNNITQLYGMVLRMINNIKIV